MKQHALQNAMDVDPWRLSATFQANSQPLCGSRADAHFKHSPCFLNRAEALLSGAACNALACPGSDTTRTPGSEPAAQKPEVSSADKGKRGDQHFSRPPFGPRQGEQRQRSMRCPLPSEALGRGVHGRAYAGLGLQLQRGEGTRWRVAARSSSRPATHLDLQCVCVYVCMYIYIYIYMYI